ARKRISCNPGRNTPGPDGLTFQDIKFIDSDVLCKNVRKILYGDKEGQVRHVRIPKANGFRTLGIGNIYDRMAQQSVLNILESILEPQFSPNSYGFRKGISAKHGIYDIQTNLRNVDSGHIYDCDLKSYFDKVKIDYVCDFLRKNHNIKDLEFFKCI